MENESDTTDGDGRIARTPISRRGLLAGAGAIVGAAGVASTQSGSGDLLSLGGASDDQDNVPVQDILVVLGDERHRIPAGETETYNGVDVRQGGEIAVEYGGELSVQGVSE